MTTNQKKINLESQKQRSILGEKFLIALYRLTTAIKIYQSNNDILLERAKEFSGITAQWVSAESLLTVQVARGQFFLNDEKLTFQRENISVIKEMLEYFEQRMNPGLHFSPALNGATIDQILTFAQGRHLIFGVTWSDSSLNSLVLFVDNSLAAFRLCPFLPERLI